jgi:hypothetical protein
MGRDTPAQWRSKVRPPLVGFAEIYKQLVSMFMKIKDMTPAQRAEFFRNCDPEDRGVEEALEELSRGAWNEEQERAVDPFYVLTLSALLGRSFKIGDIDILYKRIPNENASNIWLLSMMEFISEPSRVTLNPAIWGHQKSGHSIQPRTNRSLRLFVPFWNVQGRVFRSTGLSIR